jgi:hypothetical protein
MATTTPNFGWPVPTSTDLVKDGATAIEALGDSIDASLLDLKGGTTGQVLSKTTNTDMDFTWVTTDDANAIQNSIVDAKGDLIAATANDTPARLAVGANNLFLRANSSAATGLEWAGTYTAYTPTFTNFTLGNGTAVGRYSQIGKTVFVEIKVTLGSTSSMGTDPYVFLPVNCNIVYGMQGSAVIQDFGTIEYVAGAANPYADSLRLFLVGAGGTYANYGIVNATSPMTWTTNDNFTIRATYEAA